MSPKQLLLPYSNKLKFPGRQTTQWLILGSTSGYPNKKVTLNKPYGFPCFPTLRQMFSSFTVYKNQLISLFKKAYSWAPLPETIPVGARNFLCIWTWGNHEAGGLQSILWEPLHWKEDIREDLLPIYGTLLVLLSEFNAGGHLSVCAFHT